MTAAMAAVAVGLAPAADPAADPDRLVGRLVAALDDPEPEVRQNLAAALARVGPAAVGPLTAALRDPRPARRAGAAYALALAGPAARSAVPDLLDALADADVEVRRQVSFALSRVLAGGRPAPAPSRGGPP